MSERRRKRYGARTVKKEGKLDRTKGGRKNMKRGEKERERGRKG